MLGILWTITREIAVAVAEIILFTVGFIIGVFRFALLMLLCLSLIGVLSHFLLGDQD